MIQTIETYEDGVLIHTEQVEVPDPEPVPVPEPDALIEAIAVMDDTQKAALRAALGL